MRSKRSGKGISIRQKAILEALRKYQDANGYPPSIREIGHQVGISSTSDIKYNLDQLEAKGYIERDKRVSRSIRLKKQHVELLDKAIKPFARVVGPNADGLLQVPIVGRIVASAPVPVFPSDFPYSDPENCVPVDASLLPERAEGLFALEVSGDSMIDALVNDGDIVILKKTSEVRNGEMAAIWLDDRNETTLKYIYREDDRVRLQPANPTLGPIFIEDLAAVRIEGKVVLVVRRPMNKPGPLLDPVAPPIRR